MRRRPRTTLVLLTPLLAACTATTRPAPAHPPGTPLQAAHALPGGCGGTTPQRGGPPSWNARPAGFTRQPTLPYVLGRAGTVMGYLFRFPLTTPPPRDADNKILWYVRLPRDGHPLHVTAHPLGADHPRLTSDFPADSFPGEIYPSVLDTPRAGCWVFTLTWNGHEDTVALNFAGRPRSTGS